MAVALHHVRFVNYQPASVTAVAFAPLAPAPPHQPPAAVSSSSRAPADGACGLMAVGKGNGQVELFKWVDLADGAQGWVLYRRLVSPVGTKVDTLVFTLRQSYLNQAPRRRSALPSLDDVRLFSSGSSSDLVEWDLQRGCIMKLYPTQSGTLWSVAPNPAQTLLALGCADGSIRLLSLSDDGDLVHFRRFERTKARLLSIAWGPPTAPPKKTVRPAAATAAVDSDDDSDAEDAAEQWEDSWLVTGCSDSCLRKWDFKTGRVVERMVVEREKAKQGAKGRGHRSLVWCVGVLRDGTIVSGDSLGQVRFWDNQTSTQTVAFQAHSADVLCLAVSPDNKSVFTSGIDQKTIQFTSVAAPGSASGPSSSRRTPTKWIQSSARRFHTHDVLALAVYPPASPLPAAAAVSASSTLVAPLLVSGGVDTTLVLTPCGTSAAAGDAVVINPIPRNAGVPGSTILGDAHFRKHGSLNGVDASTVSLSASGRLLLARLESALALYRLAPVSRGENGRLAKEDGGESLGGGWEKVLDLELTATTGLVASAVSDDGRWLAVSDLGETRVFYLDEDAEDASAVPRRLKTLTATLQAQCPASMRLEKNGTGASALTFTPDSRRLVLASALTGDITIVDLSAVVSDESARLGEASVVRVFEQDASATVGGRVVAGGKRVKGSSSADSPPDGGMDVDGSDDDSDDGRAPRARGGRATVKCLAVGPDGQWLAVSDLLGRTRVYNLDTLQLHAHLPTFPSQPPAALLFVPSPVSPTQSLLLLALPNGNQLHVYDVENRRFPPSLNVKMPDSVRGLHDAVIGLATDAHAGKAEGGARNVLLWGATWILRVRLASPAAAGANSKKNKKRALAEAAAAAAAADDAAADVDMDAPAKDDTGRFKLTQTFRPLIGVGFVGGDEMVVVERPWLDLVKDLPASYFKAGKYGT